MSLPARQTGVPSRALSPAIRQISNTFRNLVQPEMTNLAIRYKKRSEFEV